MKLTSASQAEKYIHQEIALSKALNLTVEKVHPHVVIQLPLLPNQNNKKTAFAGSIASGCFLAGWLTVQNLADTTCESDVFISQSSINYLVPIREDFTISIERPAEKDILTFNKILLKKGKARLKVLGHIFSNSQKCASFAGEYVAIQKDL